MMWNDEDVTKVQMFKASAVAFMGMFMFMKVSLWSSVILENVFLSWFDVVSFS